MALTENQIRGNITKSVQNQIALQRQSINNGLKTQRNAFDSTINQNKSYLSEQIKGLNRQNTLNNDKTIALQNRRGGFYSGGLDYGLAENNRATATSRDNITRDINSKNQEINSQYNTLASQAANQISLLEQQAPDKIRELVNTELEKQRGLQMEQEKWALQKQQMELELQKLRKSLSGGGSGGGGRGGGSSKGKSKTTPSAVPSNAQQFALSHDKWFAQAKGKEQMPNSYGLHGITRESPVYGNYSPQKNVQPSSKPYKFTPSGKLKQYSY